MYFCSRIIYFLKFRGMARFQRQQLVIPLNEKEQRLRVKQIENKSMKLLKPFAQMVAILLIRKI